MIDSVTINQLRAFVAVCNEGSFSGAARELNRAQSAISHAITALESALRVELPFVPMTVRHCPPGSLTLRVLKDDLAHAHDPDPD